MAFKVFFVATQEQVAFPNSASFNIGDNGVLSITDGDDMIQYAPHAWVSVASEVPSPQIF